MLYVVLMQMVLMQQLMQVATQPSPVKAVFSHDDIELAAVALLQHLIASSSVDAGRPTNLSCPPHSVNEDDIEPPRSSYSDAVTQPAPHPVSSSSSSAAAAAAALSAMAELTAAANDELVKHAATSQTQRRRHPSAIRPTLPVVSQLMEMGFTRRKAESAVKHLGICLPFLICFHVWCSFGRFLYPVSQKTRQL